MPDTGLNSMQRRKLRIMLLKKRAEVLERGSVKRCSKGGGDKEVPPVNSGGHDPEDNSSEDSKDDEKAGGDPPNDDEKEGGMAGGAGGGGDEEDDEKVPEDPVAEEGDEEEDEGEEDDEDVPSFGVGLAAGYPGWLTSISRVGAMGDDILRHSAMQRARPLSAFTIRQRTM